MKELSYDLATSVDYEQPLTGEELYNVKNIISDLEKYTLENSDSYPNINDELDLIIYKASTHRRLTVQEEKELTVAYRKTSDEITNLTNKLNHSYNGNENPERYELDMRESIPHLIESVDSDKNITSSEEVVRLGELQEMSKSIKDHLVNSNLRLVINIAKKYQNQGVSLPDLVQEGTIGLMHSIDKFDPQKGFRLSTYSTWWIRQGISRCLHNNSRAIRLPVHMSELASKLGPVKNRLLEEFGRDPSYDEIATELNVSEELVKKGFEAASITTVHSLNKPTHFSEDLELINAIPDDYDLETTAEKSFLMQEVNERLMTKLDEQQSYVIKELFGFIDNQPKSLKEIANNLGIKPHKAAKIRNDALKLLRTPAKDLKDYLS